ncbi:MAG: hypothetical protein HKM89_10220 [Gemmatimonadales bacterium]|nr:hypothetical protein [Gemmatimonadales bacterium]
MRSTWLVVAIVLTPVACRDATPRPTGEQEAAILSVVVDSLPFAIAKTWGMPQDTPYTALLDTRAPATRLSDQLSEVSEADEPPEYHAPAWIEHQLSKPHIVGSCETGSDDDYCASGLATVLARLSQVRLTDDGGATVEVSLSRRGFAAVFELTLAEVDGAWSVVGFNLLVIS